MEHTRARANQDFTLKQYLHRPRLDFVKATLEPVQSNFGLRSGLFL